MKEGRLQQCRGNGSACLVSDISAATLRSRDHNIKRCSDVLLRIVKRGDAGARCHFCRHVQTLRLFYMPCQLMCELQLICIKLEPERFPPVYLKTTYAKTQDPVAI